MRLHGSRHNRVVTSAQVPKETYSKGGTSAEEGELTCELMKLTDDHLLLGSF